MTKRQANRAWDDYGDEVESARRSFVDGYVDVVARVADAAERISMAAAQADPRYGAQTLADAVRGTPRAASDVAMALNDGLVETANGLLRMLDMRNYSMPPGASSTRHRTHSRARDGAPSLTEAEIVAEVHGIIARGRHRGTTMRVIVRDLMPIDGHTDTSLRDLINRNFVVEDELVLPDRKPPSSGLGVPDSVVDHLRALGYTDIRRDLELERVRDDKARATLVAFVNDVPEVLVHPVRSGRLTDPQVKDDALFEVAALSHKGSPKYIYLTDGFASRFIDVAADRMITELPSLHRGGSVV